MAEVKHWHGAAGNPGKDRENADCCGLSATDPKFDPPAGGKRCLCQAGDSASAERAVGGYFTRAGLNYRQIHDA